MSEQALDTPTPRIADLRPSISLKRKTLRTSRPEVYFKSRGRFLRANSARARILWRMPDLHLFPSVIHATTTQTIGTPPNITVPERGRRLDPSSTWSSSSLPASSRISRWPAFDTGAYRCGCGSLQQLPAGRFPSSGSHHIYDGFLFILEGPYNVWLIYAQFRSARAPLIVIITIPIPYSPSPPCRGQLHIANPSFSSPPGPRCHEADLRFAFST